MRGFEYLVYSVFSALLIVVLGALPIAPVFADEEVVSESLSESSVASEEVEEAAHSDSGEDIVLSDALETTTTPDATEDTSAQKSDGTTEFDTDTEGEGEVDEDQATITETDSVDDVDTVEIAESTDLSTQRSVSSSTSATSQVLEATPNEPFDESSASTPVSTTSSSTHTASDEVFHDETQGQEDAESQTPDSTTEDDTVLENEPLSEEYLELATETATTTGTYVNEVTNDENRFSFSKDECTLVGDDTFYCAKVEESVIETYTNGVYASLDQEGDTEIYIEKNGRQVQITSNTYDDSAPMYDELSNTVVWHRLIDGRYQIMQYDVDDEAEEQITFDRFNNMEPNRYGDVLVWQGWVGDDWEIFKLENDEVKMLTDNTVHDIAPHVNGDHIIWQSFENDAWVMKVYDARTGKVQTVEGAEGGSIENPRFVLVYDTKYDSGDIETRGYDLESGEVLHLGAESAPVPDDLPDPEQTGEERALVSPNVQPKSKTVQNDDMSDDPPVPEDDIESVDDVIVPPLVIEQGTSTDDVHTAVESEISEPNIEVLPDDFPTLDLSSSTPQNLESDSGEQNIEDLIITPFVEPVDAVENTAL